MADQPSCRNCRFFRPHEGAALIIGKAPGLCAYAPPPIVARLYSMLAAEPNTQIDYEDVFEDLPEALRHGACGCHKPKT